ARSRKNPPESQPVSKEEVTPEINEDLLDMEQAIALLRTTRPTFYRWLRAGKVKGMKVGRQWRFYRADIDQFLKGEAPQVDLPADISPLVAALEKCIREAGGTPPDEEGSKLRQTAHLTLATGLHLRASDLHLHAQEDRQAVVRCRVDGVLHVVAEFSRRLLPSLVGEFKGLTGANVNEKRVPQDGRAVVQLGDASLDLRSTFLPTALGESVTMRLIHREAVVLDIARIGYAERDAGLLRRVLDGESGLIVFAGTPGSGRTTALYASLTHLNDPTRKLGTVEDPVELLLPGVVQVQVAPDAGLTFHEGLKYLARSDVDVFACGDVRDAETMRVTAALGAAEFLSLAAVNRGGDAADVLAYILRLTPEPAKCRDAVRLVVSQRLVRTLCDACAKSGEPAPDALDQAEQAAVAGGVDWHALRKAFRVPVGCGECGNTGYRGRAIVAEVLNVTPEIVEALQREVSTDQVREIALSQGATTMAAHGVQLAAQGRTTLDEVNRVLPD
ncbi:MAG: Flp pilus assembly complex ATPase component, partial [bacterium]|nr:Flp pilus assembly complex ATPase component [bacterium]